MNNLYGEKKKNCSELEEFEFLYHANWIESIWCIVISITGTTGNLLTLCAIPYAARNKLYVKSVKNVCIKIKIDNLQFILGSTLIPIDPLQFLS